jgi:hypothetical protein
MLIYLKQEARCLAGRFVPRRRDNQLPRGVLISAKITNPFIQTIGITIALYVVATGKSESLNWRMPHRFMYRLVTAPGERSADI